ncbi:MAG: PIN domain-containing protein [Nanoarchaeota archaeon]|nr:PIN domain-containing protein [Nanoarchaeota archaeon]MBU1027649.1 PIN domain-containing protein [Nanoarchaeota archaeon]
MKIIFDTFAWIEFFEGTKKGKIVKDFLCENEIITPLIVFLELSYKADKEHWNFREIVNYIKHNSEIIGMNENFIFSFGKLYNKVKKNIRGISIVDVVLLHTAMLKNAKVLTGDKHFKGFKEAMIL